MTRASWMVQGAGAVAGGMLALVLWWPQPSDDRDADAPAAARESFVVPSQATATAARPPDAPRAAAKAPEMPSFARDPFGVRDWAGDHTAPIALPPTAAGRPVPQPAAAAPAQTQQPTAPHGDNAPGIALEPPQPELVE